MSQYRGWQFFVFFDAPVCRQNSDKFFLICKCSEQIIPSHGGWRLSSGHENPPILPPAACQITLIIKPWKQVEFFACQLDFKLLATKKCNSVKRCFVGSFERRWVQWLGKFSCFSAIGWWVRGVTLAFALVGINPFFCQEVTHHCT